MGSSPSATIVTHNVIMMCKLRTTTYHLQATTHNLQPATYNLQPTNYNLRYALTSPEGGAGPGESSSLVTMGQVLGSRHMY